jgi:UDPglucose 6-dehydrogenase
MEGFMKLTIIGIDLVGLINAVGFAEKGHQVFALDSDKKKIAALRRNEIFKQEPGLQEALEACSENIRFTSEYRDSIYDASVVMLCLDLKEKDPEKDPGKIDTAPLYAALREASRWINRDITFIIRTTVPVGTHREVKSYIENQIGHKYHVNVISNPEFLSQGTAMNDMIHPSRIIAGVSNVESQQIIIDLYRSFKANLLFVTPESAELIKYASNSFLAIKLSYINEIADLCDKVGADIQQVSVGMGLDPRIGTEYFSSGVGFGGPALPQDTNALLHLGNENSVPLTILDAAVNVNKGRPVALVRKIKSILGTCAGKKFAVLGLSYKGNIDDISMSPAFKVIEALLKEDARIIAYDPSSAIANAFRKKMKNANHVDYALTLEEALRTAEYAIFLNNSSEFTSLTNDQILDYMKKPVIFDGKSIFKKNQLHNVSYYAIGKRLH